MALKHETDLWTGKDINAQITERHEKRYERFYELTWAAKTKRHAVNAYKWAFNKEPIFWHLKL